MSQSVVIKNCYGIEEAVVLKSALEAAGFHPSIDNYYHASNNWALTTALGGIQLRLPEHESERAHETLQYLREQADPDIPPLNRNYWHVRVAYLLSLDWLLALTLYPALIIHARFFTKLGKKLWSKEEALK